jgi:23S rRNA pseudouridine1911/1915/1917 synthase
LAEQIISTPPAEDETDATWDGATEAIENRPLQIPESMHGWRIDRALAELVPEFSRSYLQQLLEEGAVQWRGATAGKASAKVTVGVRPSKPRPSKPSPWRLRSSLKTNT